MKPLSTSLCLLLALVLGSAAAQAEDAGQKISDAVSGVADRIGDEFRSTEKLVDGADSPEAMRRTLDEMAHTTLLQLFKEKPEARALFDKSAGYAVFDSRKVAFILAAGFGRGVAVDRSTQQKTYMKMASVGVGITFGVGNFDNKIVILIQEQADFDTFISNTQDARMDGKAILGDSKEEASGSFVDGRKYYVLTRKGWAVTASVTGVNYLRDDYLN